VGRQSDSPRANAMWRHSNFRDYNAGVDYSSWEGVLIRTFRKLLDLPPHDGFQAIVGAYQPMTYRSYPAFRTSGCL